MVIIKYFPDATKNEWFDYCEFRLADFLRKIPREDLLKLKFYKTDIFGDEISTEDGSFINIDDGHITVINGDTIPQGASLAISLVVGAVFFVAAIALTPSVSIPETGNTQAGSTTNSLSETQNEPATIGDRIDDIFGSVKKHMPKMWQVAYRIGVNNQETEVLFLCVGRGKYEIDTNNIYDGDTRYRNITGAQANIYEPGTWPGNGAPAQSIGGVIDQPIGVYRQSTDLNATELLPPNDLALGAAATWSIVADGSTATLTLTNANALDVDLNDYFAAEASVTLYNCYYTTSNGTQLLHYATSGGHETANFTRQVLHSISGDYIIQSVSATQIVLSGFTDTISSQNIVTRYWTVTADPTSGMSSFITTSSYILDEDFYVSYDGGTYSYQVTPSQTTLYPDVGQVLSNTVGPITVYGGATKIIMNFTSFSGFYKIVETTDRSVSVSIQVIIEETDADGVATGNSIPHTFTYSSNSNSVRKSVYQTKEYAIPYEYSRVSCRRLTNRDKGENVSTVDKVQWELLYSFEDLPDDVDFGDVTTMHCVIPSNSQSRLTKKRKTRLDLVRKITQYLGDGLFGTEESYATDDATQILIHTALDKFNGRLSLDNIAADDFLTIRDEIISYFGSSEMIRFGYVFDDDQMTYEEMFALICQVINCTPYVQNGVYSMFFEKPQPTSTMQITHRNKDPESETQTEIFDQDYDGIELSFRNEETAITETIYVPTDRSAVNPKTETLNGCVTELQAYRYALRYYNKLKYNTRTVEFDVDEFGRMLVPGQRIDSPDMTRFVNREDVTDGYRIFDGEVVEVNGLNIELSQPVIFTDGEDHYIQFTNATGENSELIQCYETSNEFIVTLAQTPSDSLYAGYDRDRTKFTFCSEQVRDSIALIPKTIAFKLDNGKETNTVTSINYDARYYQGDLETP